MQFSNIKILLQKVLYLEIDTCSILNEFIIIKLLPEGVKIPRRRKYLLNGENDIENFPENVKGKEL